MAEAILEMEREDEEADHASAKEDHEGQAWQMRAAEETTKTGPIADHRGQEQA
jgi:hypothetical protein